MSTPFVSGISVLVLTTGVLLGGGCTKAFRTERLLAQAGRDFEAGLYDKAEVEYNGARQLAPLNIVAIRQLGILYYEEGRLPRAYAFLKKAVEEDPKNAQAQLKLGQASFSLGAIKPARDAAKLVLGLEPANEEALLLLSETARTTPEQAETTQLVERLRQANKDCAAYHLVLERMLLLQRDSAGAEKEVRAALALDPKTSAAYEDLGELFLLQRDSKQAGHAFRTAAQLAPLRSSRRLRDIDFRVRTGAGIEAKKDLAGIDAKAPDYIPAWVYAAKLAYSERRYDDCAAAIQKILFRDPGNFDAISERGILKLAQNNLAGALEDLKTAEELYPRVPQVKYELALAYIRSGDTTHAAEQLNQAVVLAPNFSEAILLLAELNIRRANASAAIAALDPLITRTPQIRQGYLLLAQAYLTEKNLIQALVVYRRMTTAFPKDPEPLYRAGSILGQLGHRPEAQHAFEKAVDIAPSYGPALEMLVRLDLAGKREGAAANRVRDLIAKYPKSGGPWVLQSEIDLASRQFDHAEADLSKAIELAPTSQQAYVSLARVYLATHKTKAAIDELGALVDKTKSVTAQMQIAAIHSALRQFDAAATDYRKLLAVDPKYEPALNNLAYVDCEDLGRLDEAYDLAKRAREAAPEDGRAADTLGWIMFKRGDYHGALDLLQESAGRTPEDAAVQYHLGMAHYMLGEEESARVAFEHAAASAAPADAATKEQAQGRLAVLAFDPATASPEAQESLAMLAKADPKDPIVAARLAALSTRSGTAGEAAARYESALKLAPHNPQIMLELAQLYAGPLHNPTRARELAKSAHELAPDDPRSSETLGRLVYRTGDYAWSVDLLQEAARGLPHEPDLMFDLALADYSVGRVADAEQAFAVVRSGSGVFTRRADADRFAAMLTAGKNPASAEPSAGAAATILAEDPSYLPALMVSGLAKEQEGDSSGASAVYEKILSQDPLFAPATRQLARIYVQRAGDDEKAYTLATKARTAFPDDPEVAATLGIIAYRRGDYTAAARLFQESLSRRADDAESVYYLGMSDYNLRELEESKTELQHAIDLKLSDREADDAQHVLDEMKGDGQGPSLLSQPIN